MTHIVPDTYTRAQLLAAMRYVKAHSADSFRTRYGSPMTAAEYRAWFRACLAAKINRADQRRGRKLSGQYQAEVVRDALRLRSGNLGKVLVTPEVRRRLGADHVHYYVDGTHSLCSDRDCESRH